MLENTFYASAARKLLSPPVAPVPLCGDESLLFRWMVPADEAILARACYANMPPAEFSASFSHALRSADLNCCIPIVAHIGSKLVGASQLFRLPGNAEVANLAVAPGNRRQGIGGSLMQLMIALASQLAFDTIYLSVLPNNTPALNLYYKLSFQDDHYLRLPGTLDPILVMRLALHHHNRDTDRQ
jgi:ribosomal protein S18 acetylase RimI-like enzyme